MCVAWDGSFSLSTLKFFSVAFDGVVSDDMVDWI